MGIVTLPLDDAPTANPPPALLFIAGADPNDPVDCPNDIGCIVPGGCPAPNPNAVDDCTIGAGAAVTPVPPNPENVCCCPDPGVVDEVDGAATPNVGVVVLAVPKVDGVAILFIDVPNAGGAAAVLEEGATPKLGANEPEVPNDGGGFVAVLDAPNPIGSFGALYASASPKRDGADPPKLPPPFPEGTNVEEPVVMGLDDEVGIMKLG